MLTCLVANFRFSNPLDWTGPNLASNEVLVQPGGAPGQATEPAVVRTPAAQLHATSVLPWTRPACRVIRGPRGSGK